MTHNILVLAILNVLALIAVVITVYLLRPKELLLRISFSISIFVCLMNLVVRHQSYGAHNRDI